MNEPLTDAVGNTQESPLADPPETEVGLRVPHPQPAEAWSEEKVEEWPNRGWPGGNLFYKVMALPAVLAVVGVIITHLLGGHQQTPKPPPPPVAVTTLPIQPAPPAPPPPAPSKEDRFMVALLANDAEIVQKDIAIHDAHGVCQLMGQGISWQDVANVVHNQIIGYTEKRADTFVALSIGYYCPQYGRDS